MSNYKTIKELVIETCATEGKFPSYEKLTSLVRQHFPTSKWQKTHWHWYKSKVKTGAIPVPGIAPNDPLEDDEIEDEIDNSIESSVSLERDLHFYLSSRVDQIESGLSLVEDGVEYRTDAGNIDLLARDLNDNLVVIELKAGAAKDSAIGQLLGYMGSLSTPNRNVRGILVASSFDSRAVFAARGLPSVKLVKYQLSFTLEELHK